MAILLLSICFGFCCSYGLTANNNSEGICQSWFLKSGLAKKGSACERECVSAAEKNFQFQCSDHCSEYCQPIDCEHPDKDQCFFYSSCLESKASCGAKGYALGYGEKYCLRFLQSGKFSEAGLKWRKAASTCLQRALVPAFDWPNDRHICRKIMETAFQSHVACYTQEPNSICHLPISDWKLISTEIISFRDLLSAKGIKQSGKVVFSKCRAPLLKIWQKSKKAEIREKLEFVDTIQNNQND